MQFQYTPQFLVKAFKRHYRKVRGIAEKLAAGNDSFTYSYSFEKDKGIEAKVETPNEEETLRFIVLMRRFLNPASILFYKHIWEILKEHFQEAIPPDHALQFEQIIEVVNKGPFSFIVNEQPVTAEDIYQKVADGDYFGRNDEEAVSFLQSLAGTPALQYALFEFYSYNLALFDVASMLFDIILGIERSEQYYPLFLEDITSDKRCIYCLSDAGIFTSEEHIIPESLGNYDTVLPKGYVCNRCNNEVLSGLDAELIDSDLIAFFRTWFMPYTKAGKLPQATFPNLTIKKTRPNHVVFHSQSKKSVIFDEPDENGMVRFTLNMKSRKKFDPKLLGRALYKIGLGMVAFHEGKENVCHSRYDAARAFILRGEDFPNNLLISKHTRPHPNIASTFEIRWGGTCFQLDIYGVIFCFNLETTPVLELTQERLEEINFISFPLSTEEG